MTFLIIELEAMQSSPWYQSNVEQENEIKN